MKPVNFADTVVLYEGMIIGQIKRLNTYQDHEEYYQCGLIGLWHAYERYVCVREYDERFEFEDVGTRAQDFMSVLNEREAHYFRAILCREKDGRDSL